MSAQARDRLLAENHRRFLDFLRPRVESAAVAEDILQEADAKSLSKVDQVRDEESVVAWFYQLLRNAVVDHHRRAGTENEARARLAREADPSFEPEFRQNLCTCMGTVLPDLKPEYADIVKAVEFEGRPIADVAHQGASRSQSSSTHTTS